MHYQVDVKNKKIILSLQKKIYYDAINFLFSVNIQAFGNESHKHGSDDSHVEESRQGVMKGLVGLLAIYVFFIMERLVTLFTNSKRKQKKVKHFYSV